jgi:hypothetical protein
MTEVEIEIEGEQEVVEKKTPAPTTTMIPKKNISSLTDAEKKIIIDDTLAGRVQEHYDLKTAANGNHRIIKRKPNTTTQKITKNNEKEVALNPDKIYLTDNQLMMQHIIEMRDELTVLRMKQKKYKKRLGELFYTEEDENVTEPVKDGPEALSTIGANEIKERVKEESKDGPLALSTNGAKEVRAEPTPSPKSIKALRAQYLKR